LIAEATVSLYSFLIHLLCIIHEALQRCCGQYGNPLASICYLLFCVYSFDMSVVYLQSP